MKPSGAKRVVLEGNLRTLDVIWLSLGIRAILWFRLPALLPVLWLLPDCSVGQPSKTTLVWRWLRQRMAGRDTYGWLVTIGWLVVDLIGGDAELVGEMAWLRSG